MSRIIASSYLATCSAFSNLRWWAKLRASMDDERGRSLILLPEGTRGTSPELAPFKSGLYHLAKRRPDVELVPALIDNMNRILPKGELLPAPLLGGVSFGTQPVRDHSFYLHFDADITSATVAVEQRGCAPVYVGPFGKENLDRFNDLQVKLTRGYSATVQMVDEAGRPIAGARLRSYYPGPPVVNLAEAVSDAVGNAAIEHLADVPLNIRVLADGFQADEITNVRLDLTKPYRWTLKPTSSLPGTVVSAVTGKPVAGAAIKLAGVRGPHEESCYDPKKALALTITDAQGRFVRVVCVRTAVTTCSSKHWGTAVCICVKSSWTRDNSTWRSARS